jgi:hypothetical protein
MKAELDCGEGTLIPFLGHLEPLGQAACDVKTWEIRIIELEVKINEVLKFQKQKLSVLAMQST